MNIKKLPYYIFALFVGMFSLYSLFNMVIPSGSDYAIVNVKPTQKKKEKYENVNADSTVYVQLGGTMYIDKPTRMQRLLLDSEQVIPSFPIALLLLILSGVSIWLIQRFDINNLYNQDIGGYIRICGGLCFLVFALEKLRINFSKKIVSHISDGNYITDNLSYSTHFWLIIGGFLFLLLVILSNKDTH